MRFPMALLALVGFTPAAIAADLPKGKPNIVILLADDLGWNAVGYHGGFVHTPHIDSIASRGVELDRSYVCPMCSPTRAGLMTGRYPIRFGLGRSVVRPWSMAGLPPEETTLPQLLGEAGYANRAMFGKWHMGHLDPKWHPLAHGFTHYEGCYNGAADYFTRVRDAQPDWHVDYEDRDPEGYTTDLIADAAAAFIREYGKDKSPFFCYVAFTAVHEPAQATQKYLDQYDNLKGEKRILAAQDTCMDDGIGRILDAIDQAGVARRTLVWFFSDNGGLRKIPGNNAPLRGGKLTCYEGGIRTPAAVYWPGVIEGGRRLEAQVANVDLLPTLVHAAGGGAPKTNKPLDGIDIFDELAGGPEVRRDVYGFTGQDGLEKEIISINSADGWKLIVAGPDIRRPGGIDRKTHRVELFHLSEDLLEKTDLADRESERVKALGAKLIAFRASEPQGALPTQNEKPEGFVPPKNWHNGPKN
jgi:arylsulfatase B